MFEVVLLGDSEKAGLFVLFERRCLDAELHRFWVAGVEDGVVGFGCVWDEIVGEEVVDEVAEF